MSSEQHDWQLAIRDRLRGQVVPHILAGLLLTFFGWSGGAWVVTATGIARVASMIYIYAFKMGGPVLLALALVSWSGWRVWLLVDGVVGIAIAGAFGFYGLVSVATGAFGLNAMLSLIFAVMFGITALNALSFFRASAGVPLFGGTSVVPSAGPAPPPRDVSPYEGKSLAGELMHRTRGNTEVSVPPPVARPVEAPRAESQPLPPPAQPAPPPRPVAHEPPPAPKPPPATPPPPKPAPASPPPPPVDAPDGFLAALAREDDEDDDTSRG